jgi:hypothetical protein
MNILALFSYMLGNGFIYCWKELIRGGEGGGGGGG